MVVIGQLEGDVLESEKRVCVAGASNVYEVLHDSLKDLYAEALVDALEAVYMKAQPDLVLISSTKKGKEVAPRLATRLKVACISDAIRLELAGKELTADRVVWGGNAIATVVSKGVTVVTIPVRAYERATGSTASPNIVKVEFQPKHSANRVAVIGKREKAKGQASIKDAERIVSAGRGFKKKEDLGIIDDLVKILNAAVGASRPLTSDLGWMPEDRQVGLSGTTVKPKLYVAIGISGQIQHLTGMRDSKVIVAVNQDKNAPIFQECDYGIVGDLYSVVPALTKALVAELKK